jgi:hypothetical protein
LGNRDIDISKVWFINDYIEMEDTLYNLGEHWPPQPGDIIELPNHTHNHKNEENTYRIYEVIPMLLDSNEPFGYQLSIN